MDATVSRLDILNQLAASFKSKDAERDALMSKILSDTELLVTDSDSTSKYNKIVSIEYILVRLRLDIEFEHIKVKSILEDKDTDSTARLMFIKRDKYLATILLKLNSIRDDISVLQKVVYTRTNFNLSK